MYKGSKKKKRNRERLSKDKFYKMKNKKHVENTNEVRDKHNNLLCSICKLILRSSKDEIKAPHLKHCCKDCNFGSFCHDCCLTVIAKDESIYSDFGKYDDKYVSEGDVTTIRTCGVSMMRQLVDKNFEGIHACLSQHSLDKIKEQNKEEFKYKVRLDTLSGKIVNYL